MAGTELEFIAFDTTYEAAADAAYRDLTPANQYNVDYSILGTSRVEPLLRAIRNTMYDAGLDVEGAKGECNFGQHEIGFLYADALTTADNHSVYKTVAKEIAAQQGKAITFMAKYNEREGSSCHIHLSLRGTDGSLVFWDADADNGHAGRRALRPLRGRHPRDDRRLHAVLRAEHQLLQAVRGRLVRTDRDRLGHRQPHLLGPAGRARRGRPDGEPGARRRRQPLPRAGRDAGRRPARDRARAAAGARAGRQRLRLGRRARAVDPGGRPGAVRLVRAGPRGVRRRGRGPLHQHGRRRAGGLRRRGHRLGAPERIRAAVCDHARSPSSTRPPSSPWSTYP